MITISFSHKNKCLFFIFQIKQPFYKPPPFNKMPLCFPTDSYVLDLRIPEKQKGNSVNYTYTSVYPNHHAFLNYQQQNNLKGSTQTIMTNNFLRFNSFLHFSPFGMPPTSVAAPAHASPYYQKQNNQGASTQVTAIPNKPLPCPPLFHTSPSYSSLVSNHASPTYQQQNSEKAITSHLYKSVALNSPIQVSPVGKSSTSATSTVSRAVSLDDLQQKNQTSTHVTAIPNGSLALQSPLQVSAVAGPSISTAASSDPFLKPRAPISKPPRLLATVRKDPLIGIKAVSLFNEDVDYKTFRDKFLSKVEYSSHTSNANMRRKTISNEHINDPAYWEKRKKNNEAAKKSRDARKSREDEMAIRCAFLEQENLKLKFKVSTVHSDVQNLQKVVYKR